MTTHALPSPPEAAPGPEASWLPASPSGGILERLRASDDAAADDEWWHEERRNACRAYIGTCLNWRAGLPGGKVAVSEVDLHSDIHRALLADIRAHAPWADVLDLYGAITVGPVGHCFGATTVRLELADCLALGSRWEDVDAVAEAVHFCRRRDERAKIIKRMAGVAHSPTEVADLCARLGEVL